MLVDFGNCKPIKRRKGSISSMEHIRSIFKMGKRIFFGRESKIQNQIMSDSIKNFKHKRFLTKLIIRNKNNTFVCVKSDFTNFFADILDISSFFPIGQWLHSSRRSGGDQQMELVQWCDHFFFVRNFSSIHVTFSKKCELQHKNLETYTTS